jgi:HSP20 family protein
MAKELALWRPFREMQKMRREMDRLWDSFLEERPGRRGEMEEIGAWLVPLSLSETGNEFIVKAEVPGLEPKDIDISLSGDLLTIKGERKEEKEEKGENYYFNERNYGAFSRAVRLPAQVQGEKIKVSHKNGLLTITLPKSEEAKRKEIKVKVE